MSIVAVAGGTGLVGRLVVEAVRRQGHVPIVMARSRGVDLLTGAGLDEALAGADAVIDVSNIATLRGSRATAFFETSTRNLLQAGRRAGVRHHVALSIVGVDRVALGYYQGKQRQEQLVSAGDVPWTLLRATQFHEFAAQMLARRGPVAVAPRMRSQPVAAAEVAEALAGLALREPVGRAPDLAGPEERQMTDLIRRLARHRGSRKLIVPVTLPGAGGRALVGGALLPTEPGPRGVLTFTDWVGAQPRDR